MKPYYEDAASGITIYHGDCRDILPNLPTADILLTDPPWIASKADVELRGRGVAPAKQRSTKIKYGAVGHFDPSTLLLATEKVSHDCLIICGYKELGAICAGFGQPRGVFGWHKPNGTPTFVFPAKMDLAFIVWAGKETLLPARKQVWPSMVFSHPFPAAGCMASERFVDATGKALHPCQGPLSLYADLLRPFPAGSTVLDCYMGTGTTLRAAKNLGLKAIGIDSDERWCELAARRLEQGVLQFSD